MKTMADKIKAELDTLNDQLLSKRAQIKPLQQDVSRLENQIRDLSRDLESAERQPRVSDHAVVRFLERKHGFDFEDVRASLMPGHIADAIKAGATSAKVNGCTLVIKDQCVVTVK